MDSGHNLVIDHIKQKKVICHMLHMTDEQKPFDSGIPIIDLICTLESPLYRCVGRIRVVVGV